MLQLCNLIFLSFMKSYCSLTNANFRTVSLRYCETDFMNETNIFSRFTFCDSGVVASGVVGCALQFLKVLLTWVLFISLGLYSWTPFHVMQTWRRWKNLAIMSASCLRLNEIQKAPRLPDRNEHTVRCGSGVPPRGRFCRFWMVAQLALGLLKDCCSAGWRGVCEGMSQLWSSKILAIDHSRWRTSLGLLV